MNLFTQDILLTAMRELGLPEGVWVGKRVEDNPPVYILSMDYKDKTREAWVSRADFTESVLQSTLKELWEQLNAK